MAQWVIPDTFGFAHEAHGLTELKRENEDLKKQVQQLTAQILQLKERPDG